MILILGVPIELILSHFHVQWQDYTSVYSVMSVKETVVFTGVSCTVCISVYVCEITLALFNYSLEVVASRARKNSLSSLPLHWLLAFPKHFTERQNMQAKPTMHFEFPFPEITCRTVMVELQKHACQTLFFPLDAFTAEFSAQTEQNPNRPQM